MDKPTVDIAVAYLPDEQSGGDYVLADFLVSTGRLIVWGFPTQQAVRDWVDSNPPAFVTWQWRNELYVDRGDGKLVPSLRNDRRILVLFRGQLWTEQERSTIRAIFTRPDTAAGDWVFDKFQSWRTGETRWMFRHENWVTDELCYSFDELMLRLGGKGNAI